jgi:penicillin V acylase-like amidase (Ntn superfamily)
MCTRILWSSGGAPGEGVVLVARSCDWMEDTGTNLWVLPRGIRRTGLTDAPTVEWTSKYGSLMASIYSLAGDALNEAGFSAAGLYLDEADYGERDHDRPGIAMSLLIQYFVDNFATVSEAVAWAETSGFQIVPMLVGTEPGTAHVAIADPSGDSAVIEFLGGKTVIYHGTSYQVMANSPTFEEQLENVKRYQGFGGTMPIPASVDSAERFVRAAYFTAALTPTEDTRQAIASLLSVIRVVSPPFGTDDLERPNIAPTRWRTLQDLTNHDYYFESTTAPNLFWVHLDKIDFEALDHELRIDLSGSPDCAGDVTGLMQPATMEFAVP